MVVDFSSFTGACHHLLVYSNPPFTFPFIIFLFIFPPDKHIVAGVRTTFYLFPLCVFTILEDTLTTKVESKRVIPTLPLIFADTEVIGPKVVYRQSPFISPRAKRVFPTTLE